MHRETTHIGFPNARKAAPSAKFDLVAGNKSEIANGPQADAYSRWGKRLFDVTVVVLVLPFILPLMAILFGLIAFDGGKPIFKHQRVGRDGRIFGCLKFRTMVHDAEARLNKLLSEDPAAAEEWAASFKLRDDPRITRFGRAIRKSSLDELPQLWNVLRGDMSLIGPRPVTEAEIPLYGLHAEAYHSVRPGLTGIWQVSGRNSLSFDERVELDRRYVERLSFLQDLRILLLTVPAVLHVTGR